MHAHNGRVDHLHRRVMRPGERAHDHAPDARSSPANETIVAGRVRTEVVRQVAPWRPGSQDPEDAIEDAAVIHSWHAPRLIGQHRLDGSPFVVGELVAHDSVPSVRSLNHGSAVRLNEALTDGDLVAMRPKADSLCSLRVLPLMTPKRTCAAVQSGGNSTNLRPTGYLALSKTDYDFRGSQWLTRRGPSTLSRYRPGTPNS